MGGEPGGRGTFLAGGHRRGGGRSQRSLRRRAAWPSWLLFGLTPVAVALVMTIGPAVSAGAAASSSPAPVASGSGVPGATSPAPAGSPLPTSSSAPPGSGAAIFAQNCAGCHGPQGQGLICPSLAAAGFPDLVESMVRDGGRLLPGLAMPPFRTSLTNAEIKAVAGYVSQELADPASHAAQVADGGEIFRLYCSGCHGAMGRGGALAKGKNAASFAGKPAAAALAAMIIGPLNMPVFTSTLDVTQQAAVARYVQVLVTPPSPGGNGLGFRGPVAEGFATLLGLLALIVFAIWLAWGKKGKSHA